MSSEASPTAPKQSAYRRLRAAIDSRPWLKWLLDGVLLFSVIAGVGLWQTRAHVGGQVPAFSLETLGGGAVSSQTLLGKPTVLAFWAPWCGVCEAESGNVGWVRSLVGDRANVLSVATAYDRRDAVTAYVQRNGVDYPVLLDERGLADALRVTSFPTVYFLDETGRIKGSVVGYTTTAGLLLRTLW